MHSTRNAAGRLRHRLRAGRTDSSAGSGRPPSRRRIVPVAITLVAVTGAVAGVVVATVGGKPSGADGQTAGLPSARPAPASAGASATPVVPLLGGTTDGRGTAVRIPVASPFSPSGSPSSPGSSRSPGAAGSSGSSGPAASAAPAAGAAPAAAVAPLSGLRQADLLVVAPFSLSPRVLATVSRQPGVTGAVPIEAAKVKINGVYTAVLGVDPSTFRGYAAAATAASDPLWQGVANGGIAVSYTMGKLDKLALGGRVTVAGHRLERLPVVAFGTVGIGGVDAVVSDSVARSLGMPGRNAIVVSAPPSSVASLVARIKQVIPHGSGVEPLVTQVTRPTAAGLAPSGVSAVGVAAAGDAMAPAQLLTALRAAESRRGLPYRWGAAGPASFDCSGLVQWSFAQAGIVMPRVAADQARTGMAVPVGKLAAGDLLFYHTDPTAPGYISHVAIYLGNGWMIQAPQPGMNVEVVPASFDSQFAGAVRVYPRIAARVAAGLA